MLQLQSGPAMKLLSILRQPIPDEARALLKARWDSLPPELKNDRQVLGRHLVHCGYTMGASYCSLGCTHCYLPPGANRVPLPSLDEMREQIDANRRLIGPGGGLQITGGDVVDAYWRADRIEELVELVRYANQAGVVPMLMTHGQVLLEHPWVLERLVTEGGLRKIALHIDITQAGRPGYPIRGLRSEADLHPLRQAFVDLILRVRRSTRTRFFAAHTVTVTERNLASVPEILHWLLADPRHLRAFRMVSFQTEADVGRTRFSQKPATPGATWAQICRGLGVDLPRDNLEFGHPDCSNMTSLLVLFPERRVINLIPSDPRSRAFWSRILNVLGGTGARGEFPSESVLRKLSTLARHPATAWSILAYALRRMREEGLGPGFVGRALTGRLGALNIVLHNFMSASDLERPRREVIETRLSACSFRGAVRRNGAWVAVPMCEMNVDYRESIYAQRAGRST